MKKKINLFYFATVLFSFICGAIGYIASNNLYIGIGVVVVYILFFIVIFMPALQRFLLQNKKRHQCYQFVNAFIISLSVCHSFDRAYEIARDQFDEELKVVEESIESSSCKEKVFYLENYFELDIYDMFLSILTLYLDQGGDILKISSELLAELSRIEDTAISINNDSRRSLFEFATLWGISLIILGFLRFALRNFFNPANSSFTFVFCIILFFIILLLSIYIFFMTYFGQKAFMRKKGVIRNEKLKEKN